MKNFNNSHTLFFTSFNIYVGGLIVFSYCYSIVVSYSSHIYRRIQIHNVLLHNSMLVMGIINADIINTRYKNISKMHYIYEKIKELIFLLNILWISLKSKTENT